MMAASRRRAREQEVAEIIRLTDMNTQSPGAAQLVRYAEAKSYVLEKAKAALQHKLIIAEQEILSLRGHFTYAERDQEWVRSLSQQLQVRWQKDGSSQAVREKRADALLRLRDKIRVAAGVYDNQRKQLQMLRAREQMESQRVAEDAAIADAQRHHDAVRLSLQRQANNLKIATQKAALAAKQSKIDEMAAFNPLSSGGSGVMLGASTLRLVSSAAAASRRKAAAAVDDDDDYAEEESAAEVARHAAEDAQEEREEMEDALTEQDRAFIAPESE
jgi:hypothetical protein